MSSTFSIPTLQNQNESKTLGAELTHAYTLYSISAFYADDHLPTLNARR